MTSSLAEPGLGRERGPTFWITLVLGGGIVAFALAQLRAESGPRGLQSAAMFVIGSGVVHDAVWAPVVVLAGAITAVVVPAWARVPVRLGLAFSALVLLVSWPVVRGYGARSRDPSFLPLDYTRGLALVLVAIWSAVVLVVAFRLVARRAVDR